MVDITVAIPVGPHPVYLKWLPECVESVINQEFSGNIEIFLLSDGADFSKLPDDLFWKGAIQNHPEEYTFFGKRSPSLLLNNILFSAWHSPWNLGVADMFNIGVALAEHNLVFMLGSDDKLMPTCLEECAKAWEENNKIDGWYNVTLKTAKGAIVTIFNNAAMVTKKLWQELGGFPPSAGIGACDALVLSIMLTYMPERIFQVKEGRPLYWMREHPYQDTTKNMAFFASSGVIEIIRKLETQRWKPKK